MNAMPLSISFSTNFEPERCSLLKLFQNAGLYMPAAKLDHHLTTALHTTGSACFKTVSMEDTFDVVFKSVRNVPLFATVFPARQFGRKSDQGAPLALYFHSGGLTGGSRLGYFPYWLSEYCNEKGIHLATLDYRLIPTGTLKDVEDDCCDGYRFCATELSKHLVARSLEPVDTSRMIVYALSSLTRSVCNDTDSISLWNSTSASAGVLAASLLVLRILEEAKDLSPPRIFLGLYGMTNIASSFYNVPKDYEASVGKETSQRSMAEVAHLFDPSRAPVMGTDIKWFRTTIDSVKTENERVEYDQTNL